MVTAKSLGSTVGNVGLIFVYGLGVGLCWYFGLGTMQSFTRGADHDIIRRRSYLVSGSYDLLCAGSIRYRSYPENVL